MFTIIDGLLVILILLCVFMGARRGLIGSIIKMFGGLIRLILSIVLAKPLVNLLSKITTLDEHMFNKFTERASKISDKFNVNLVGMSEEDLNDFVEDALSDAKVPKLFRGLFQNIFSVNPDVIAEHESITLADMMGVTIANIILLISSFIFIFVALWLIGFLCKRWSIKLSSSTTLFARTNKWLGALLGLVKSIVITFVVFFVVAIVENVGILNVLTDLVNNSLFSGPIYRLAKLIVDSSFDLKAALEGWLVK